ncbi:alpha-L-arabinofuranosidase [Flavobacterium alvei]|uniref:Alpha-L-arabinofuranosidase n=1 Tax=Flavobacterium alvei TaxID=2080416 RepID=A0A2S5A4Y6_9FLAO|nr:alpha-L-arabinofuranosidase [Flavobacterium alvei]POY37661.1 alpha-L-arabinofuranosidase [Flavobacterium alvei]
MKTYKISIVAIIILGLSACSSQENPTPIPVTPTPEVPVIKPQVDPTVENTVGFFMDNWSPKNWTSPTNFVETAVPTTTNSTVTIDYANVITKIPTTIYGNNANLWSGKMVTDTKLVSDLTNLKTNIIRFPGGSISDVYFWNAASNPSTVPSTMVNSDGTTVPSNFWFGKNDANWTISLDNYYQLLQATNSKGLITVNYGYARYGTGTNPVQDAAKLAADWVKYDNGRTQYWEIGNENFGDWEARYRINTALNKDGQPEFLTGELYAQHFKIIAAAMREAAKSVGNTNIKIGAVLFESKPETWMSTNNKTWNDKLLPTILEEADYYVLHSYFTAIANVDAVTILETPKARINEFTTYVKNSLSANNRQIKPFALDEWNIFANGSKQQVSHINGLHSVLLLGEVLKNKIGLAARWDLFNGWSKGDDHGLFSNGDEPNIPKGNPRPAFYQMYYFQKNMGDRLIDATKDATGNYEVYASSFSDGKVGITFVNKATTAITIKIKLNNFLTGKRMYWYSLVGDTDNGEFSRKVIINGTGPTLEAGGPTNYETIKPYSASTTNGTNVTLPARSSVFVVIEKQ